MFENVIIELNPHWVNKPYEDGIKRDVFDKLLQYIKLPHVISVTGVRRSGKSTLIKQLINYLIEQGVLPKNILFLNLEHPYFTASSKDVKNLQKIYEDYLKIAMPVGEVYICLDEVQFFSNWPVFVKALYEQKKAKFIVTGSNSSLLSTELMTLLSGRTIPIEVFPLSFHEIIVHGSLQIHDLISLNEKKPILRNFIDQYLMYGGFPEVILTEIENAFDILNAYSKSIIYQDVTPRLSLKKVSEVERLFFYLISNMGSCFSYHSLSKIFDLSDKTIKEFIDGFKEAKLLFLIEFFEYSLKKQMRHPKKIYSIDPGFFNAAAFKFSENKGKLLENIVFLELKRQNTEVYYFKTKEGFEIDFLVKKGMEISLFQVCLDLQGAAKARELRALKTALKELKLKNGTIITLNEEEQIIEDELTIQVLPIYKFLLSSYF